MVRTENKTTLSDWWQLAGSIAASSRGLPKRMPILPPIWVMLRLFRSATQWTAHPVLLDVASGKQRNCSVILPVAGLVNMQLAV